MQYSIELYFDRDTERALQQLAQSVASRGISRKYIDYNTRPHIALACFNSHKEEECIKAAEAFAKRHKEFSAVLSRVGMFPAGGVVFASPVTDENFYEMKNGLYRYLAKQISDFDTTGWELYLPGAYTPHCTLAMTEGDGADAFLKASQLILSKFKVISGRFSALRLNRATFPIKNVGVFPLGCDV